MTTEAPAATTPEVAATHEDHAADVDLGLVRRYRELRNAATSLEAEFKAIKAEADTLERTLIESFADAGVQNINIDGQTVYLHRSTFATRCEGIEAADVIAALRDAPNGADLIKDNVNANSLSAYVREFVEGEDAPGLPESLVGVIDLGERYSVRLRAGAKPRAARRSA